MNRIARPELMTLHACVLPVFRDDKRVQEAIGIIRSRNDKWEYYTSNPASPVVLRWSTNPIWGFPVRPFQIYRRRAATRKAVALVPDPVKVAGTDVIEWSLGEVYIVSFQVAAVFGSLTVEALDKALRPIPGHRTVFTGSGNGEFAGAGIAGLRVSGNGVIENIRGTGMDEYVNLPDWELIEVVGLPVRPGEVSRSYDTYEPQGVVPPVWDGYEASEVRLRVAQLLAQDPPPTGDPAIPTPVWAAPDAYQFRDFLCDRSPSQMEMIRECLEKAVFQYDYMYEIATEGPRQSNFPGAAPAAPIERTELKIPVVPVTILSVSSDSSAATGLGYGTIDFPGLLDDNQENDVSLPGLNGYEYMVVGEFEIRGYSIEVAAPAVIVASPIPPSGLTSKRRFVNRPPGPDLPLTETVELSWLLPNRRQGYAVAVSRQDGNVTLLNEPSKDGWHHPFIPQFPQPQNGNVPVGSGTQFIDEASLVPFTGTAFSDYIVSGLDVFGRWSEWRKVSHESRAPEVQKPGVHAVRFMQNGAPGADGSIPYTIEIEFSWNQEDRRVHSIDFTGHFFALTEGATPDAAPGSSFQLSDTAAGAGMLRVHFDYNGIPRLPLGSPFSIDLPVQPVPVPFDPPEPDLLKYVLRVRGAKCTFSAGASKIGYAVYAAARERVREPYPDSDSAYSATSAPTAPVVATVADPRPPEIPTISPAAINWTALPDAMGRARGVLRWTPAARAAGYEIWQATESALRQAISLPEEAPGTSLVDRSVALRTALASPGNHLKALRVFSRMNTDLVRATQLEIELPGSANTLFAYRVSAVGANNEASERSVGIVFFGVPVRNQPGRPKVLVRAGAGGHFVVCLAAPGAAAEGFNVFRMRDPSLLIDAGAVGDPRITPTSAGWHSLDTLPADPMWDTVRAAIRTLPPESAIGKAIFDPAPVSWRPYYYAVTALGRGNPAQGEYRGESALSASQQVLLPPPSAPAISVASFLDSGTGSGDKILRFHADLPVRPTPAGKATIVIYKLTEDGGRVRRERMLRVHADEVAEVSVLPLAEIPEIRRDAPNNAGIAAYEVRLDSSVLAGAIVVTDPLGRSKEVSF